MMIASAPTVADTILRKITTRTDRRVRDLVVVVTSAGVKLSGQTGSFHMKQLAQHSVREVLPTTPIQNGIEVK
ncbi:MAG TPA: hypothetical protein VN641_13520 [Urbifossiella sp.]|nr:hypothetical protein [Urbifossiella sp.]